MAGGNDDAADSSPRWRSVAAGFLVLRLVDTWATEAVIPADTWRATLATVAEVPITNPIRGLLDGVANAVVGPSRFRAGSPIVPLMAYAKALEFDAEWLLAADVYTTIVDHAPVYHSEDLLAEAFHRLGYCRRLLGDLPAAAAAFAEGRRAAQAEGNAEADLWLRLSECNLLTHRGNLPAAALALDTLISDAATVGAMRVATAAGHDRALVAYSQGDYERAAVLCHAAVVAYVDPRQRARALADLATCAAALGHVEMARRANEVVCATAAQRDLRWTAVVNLLEDAVLAGRETVFEHYRSMLANEALPVQLAATYQLYTARGQARFGRSALARQSFERALAIAEGASLNQIVILADAGLAALDAPRSTPDTHRPTAPPPPAPVPTSWPPAVERIASAVDELHATTVGR